MTWGLIYPCWNCERGPNVGDNTCKDAEHIQNGINEAHSDLEGHKGAGNIVMSCAKMTEKKSY